MARAVCKQLIDNPFAGIHKGVERAIEEAQRLCDLGKSPVKDDQVQKWRQRLADVEIACIHGVGMPEGGLLGIVADMEKHGLVDRDVWRALPSPASP